MENWPCWTTVLMGEATPLHRTGDEDTASAAAALTGDGRVVACVVLRPGDVGDKDQGDFNGEPAGGEWGGELEEEIAPPSPAVLAWPGTVIGAAAHGG